MSDWKEKYLQLAELQESESARFADNEQLLCRAIVRLTIAASGLDPTLDPHLKRLQTAAKGDTASPKFKRHLTELSDELVRNSDNRESAENRDLFGRLTQGCNTQGRSYSRLNKLYTKLAKDPVKATDAELDQLLLLLMQCHPIAAESTTKKVGVLGKLLGADHKSIQPNDSLLSVDAEDNASPNETLLELLRRLRWPRQLDTDIRKLSEKLSAEADKDSAWVEIMEEVTQLFSNALDSVESDLHDTESFLEGLNSRLKELDAIFQRMNESREASLESGRQLRKTVGEQVGEVREDVTTAKDLVSFKAAVSLRLDTIQTKVEEYLLDDQGRLKAHKEDVQQMQERMKALEEEGQELRTKLEESQSMAVTDALTGLPNRMGYQRQVDQEYARWKRFGKPLSLLVWDIDYFKRVNDSFGHQAGDKALKVIAQALASRVRATDFVARYGGEEFVMLMPGSDAKQVGRVANEIRLAVEKKPFHAGKKRIPITISCGYAEIREGESPADTFKRADAALYKAKQAGRNCCVQG